MANLEIEWRGAFSSHELNALHAEAFAHPLLEIDWAGQVRAHGLGWATARDCGDLVGFINVAWDGGVHAFLLDTMVREDRRREGIGRRLVAVAAAGARAAGCEWLHVDFEEEHRPFHLEACGFEPTAAGLMRL